MRLISCYIENYGTLSGFSLRFNEGLTVINEDNGFGKSTLASFIKAMFYGLPQTAKRKVEENERRLRSPWQGGNFGGSLEFETRGKQYRIERFFGAKANADTFKLFDLSTGKETDDFSENIGVELFGIDAEGYERSVFLPQLDAATESNVSIMTKLTDLVENSDDINNYDKAVVILEKRRGELTKLNGKKGSIAELRVKIADAEAELKDSKAAYENVKELTARMEAYKKQAAMLEGELLEVRKDLSTASNAAAALANKKRRDELAKEIAELSCEIKEINKKYPAGLPDSGELEAALKDAEELKRLSNEYRMLVADDQGETEELKKLSEVFEGSGLTDEVLAQKRSEVSELSSLKTKAAAKKELLQGTETPNQPAKKSPVKALIIVAAVVAAAGAVLLTVDLIIGLIVLFAALILGGVSAFIYLKGMIVSNAPKGGTADVSAEYDKLSGEIARREAELGDFFAQFRLSGELSESVYSLSSLKKDYDRLKSSVEARENKKRVCAENGKAVRQRLEDLFRKFSVNSEDFSGELLKMRDAARSFVELAEDLAEKQKRFDELPAVDEAKLIGAEEHEALKVRERELGPKIDMLRKAVGEFESRIAGLIPAADKVSELENEIESLESARREQEEQLFILEKTLDLLSQARDGLTGRYRDPLADGFKKYAGIMLGEDIGEFMMDNELSVHLSRFGKAMDKGFFSTGYRDLIDIATRFALVDALYDAEKPAVILDDPFVNLDQARLENALKLLEKLAEDRQMIYLTCHPSRIPR